MGSDPGAQGNSIQSNGPAGPGPKLRHHDGLIGSYSRPICAELEASPVSPPNWAGLARALYIGKALQAGPNTRFALVGSKLN
jgi:hypothetical protein